MASTPQPRVALFPTTLKTWSDGTPFNGYFWVALAYPTDGTTPWASMAYGNTVPGITLPQVQMIPITAGVYNPSCGLLYNNDLIPEGSTYYCAFYDATRRLVSPQGGPFVVSTPTVTVPALVANAPTNPGTPPTPDS